MSKKMSERKGDNDSMFGSFGININLSMFDKNEINLKEKKTKNQFVI